MAKLTDDSVLNAAIAEIEKADQLVLCDGQPSSYADATTDSGSGGNALGEVAVAGGDFTRADGDVSGRKVTVASKSVTIDVAGDVDHVALVDDGASVLLHVATANTTSVTVSQSLDTQAFDIEFEDPS